MALDLPKLKRIAERLREKKQLQERLRDINRDNKRDMPVALEEMAQEGVRAHDFIGVGNLHMKREVRAKFHPDIAPPEDAEDEEKLEARFKVMQALDAAGLGQYARRSIDWNGLTSRLKEMDEQGEPLPEELDGVLELRKGHVLALNASRYRNNDNAGREVSA